MLLCTASVSQDTPPWFKEDRAGYLCIGLARVTEVTADRRASSDDRWIPPALLCSAALPLSGLISEFSGMLNQRGWILLDPGVWIMIVLAVMVAGLLRFTRLGRHIYAIGSNELTARLCVVMR